MNAILRILGFRAAAEAARHLPPVWSRRIVLWVAVFANVLPVVGVVRGWMSAADVFVAYWLDLVIVGGFSLIRVFTATGGERSSTGDRITMAVFFSVLYGLLVVLQAMFLVMLFDTEASIVAEFIDRIGFLSSDEEIVAGTAWLPVALALLLSEVVALLLDWFARGDRHQVGISFAMLQPFGQMVPMVLIMTVLGGVGTVLVRYLHLAIVPVTLLAATRLSIFFGHTAWMRIFPRSKQILRLAEPPEQRT